MSGSHRNSAGTRLYQRGGEFDSREHMQSILRHCIISNRQEHEAACNYFAAHHGDCQYGDYRNAEIAQKTKDYALETVMLAVKGCSKILAQDANLQKQFHANPHKEDIRYDNYAIKNIIDDFIHNLSRYAPKSDSIRFSDTSFMM
jgi:hypothetical protein